MAEEVWDLVSSGMTYREVAVQVKRSHTVVRKMYLRWREFLARVEPSLERREEHRAALRQAWRRAIMQYEAAGTATIEEVVRNVDGSVAKVQRAMHLRDVIRLRLEATRLMKDITDKSMSLDGFGVPGIGLTVNLPNGNGNGSEERPAQEAPETPERRREIRRAALALDDAYTGQMAVEVEVGDAALGGAGGPAGVGGADGDGDLGDGGRVGEVVVDAPAEGEAGDGGPGGVSEDGDGDDEE